MYKGFPDSSVGKESACNAGDPVQFLGWEDLLEKGQAIHFSILGLPLWLSGKESACSVGDLGLVPGLGRSPGKGKGYPLQYFGLENSTYSPWGCKESDTTEGFHFLFILLSVLYIPWVWTIENDIYPTY